MKLKNIKKKIAQLEARLQAGPNKLARLKRKLEASVAAKARKAQTKAAASAVARQRVKSSSAKRKKPASSAKGGQPGAAKPVKKKLNISPERRAQLSAAMKARWAAKRAGAETNPASKSVDPSPPAG